MAAEFYLPDDCWERVFRFLFDDEVEEYVDHPYKYVTFVSKQFLSITDSLRFSLTICRQTRPFLCRLFQRFTNLTSLDLSLYKGNLDGLLNQISRFPLKITSLYLSDQHTIPAKGLLAFSKNITTLTSLTCSNFFSVDSTDLILIADCFPNLQLLDLKGCDIISAEGIFHVLRRCCCIRYLNLDGCLGLEVKLRGVNFEFPKLEVLKLSHTRVDDDALYVISKSCCGLLKLYLESCYSITEKGVKHVVENCTKLRKINLRYCRQVHGDVLASLIFSRPSLRMIKTPYHYRFSDREMELLSL